MKNNTLALILALVAGALCFGSFFYKWLSSGRIDYVILLAGIFIVAFGIGNHTRKKSDSA